VISTLQLQENNMRVVFVFLCVCFASTLGLRLRREVKYTNKYDKIDIDKILGSERLLKNYSNCLLDLGNCTPEGSELKRKFYFYVYSIYSIPSRYIRILRYLPKQTNMIDIAISVGIS